MERRLGAVVLLVWTGLVWGAQPALVQQQAQAKQQQVELQAQISKLQNQIDSQESSRRDAAHDLKASESQISDINAKLADLQAQTAASNKKLVALRAQTDTEQQQLVQRQTELADQLRAQYASGLSPWTALLSGDDPHTIGRDLAYLGYVSAAQAESVRKVRAGIERLDALRKQTQTQETTLSVLAKETNQQKQALLGQQTERQKVLARIETQLQQQRGEAGRLEKNDARLGTLITGLEAAIAKQAEEARIAEAKRKAEVARKADEARKAEAERQAEATRQAEAARIQVEQARAKSRDAEQEQVVKQQQAAEQQEVVRQQQLAKQQKAAEQQRAIAAVKQKPDDQKKLVVAGLRKGMTYPVRGETIGRFGAQRPDGGGVWRGVVLRSPEGTPVQVISSGKVAYANWLAGFGNIIIVDHGASYLSVYAHNQSLLKQVGDTVSVGDTIATVGATGGQVESGLYFEIRHKGTPVNPLLWLQP